MASGIDKLAKELKTMMTASDDRKPKPFDSQAEVLRVEDGIAWVHIPGGVEETPVRLTMDAKKGDMVNIRVANGSAWITGNGTNPPTDNTVANEAKDTAARAMTIGEMAMDDATRARVAADTAESEAVRAGQAATNAQNSADAAQSAADAASAQALTANVYANNALYQLGIVQDVVGVLDLLSTNATYKLTQDTEIVAGKWYFTRSGTSPDYIYTVVTDPVDADLSTYYELVSIDQAVENYLTSRIAVTSAGLWIQDPSMATKILLSSTDGVVLYGPSGTVIGKYGANAQVGDATGFHIKIDGTELGFYQADRKVAYISNQQLYITQSVVLQQMDLGTTVNDGGLGQWSWKVHANGATPSRNNLNLKWIG